MQKTIINQRNINNWLDYIDKLAQSPDKWCNSYNNGHWLNNEVTMEVTLGQIAESFLKTVAIIGRGQFDVLPITGDEGFATQGLEGKAIFRKPLRDCLLSTYEIAPHHWRILCDDNYLQTR